MARTHRDFKELSDSIHGHAKASGPLEATTRISGMAAPKNAADKKRTAKRLAEGLSQAFAMAGLRPKHRADRPGRKNGGRTKETVNVIVGQPSGVAPPLGLMRPPVGPMAAPVAGAGQRIGGRSDGPLKGSFANHQGGVSGSASFARGGAVGAVSHGESLNQIRKRTQS